MGRRARGGLLFMNGGGCLSLLLLCGLLGLCTFSGFLIATIAFPAVGLRIASETLFVNYTAEVRPPQVVVSESGATSKSTPYTLTLDGRVVAQGRGEFSSDQWVRLTGLTPGPHTLRLEAWDGRRRVAHEVTFTIVQEPTPWTLQRLDADTRFVAFDALGRPHPLVPGEEQGAVSNAVFYADGRGVFAYQEGVWTLWPWADAGLGPVQPLPEAPRGQPVGPGVVLQGNRLHRWARNAWEALPPLPRELPPAVAEYFAGYEGRVFGEHAQFFWARPCGDALWVSLTWRVRTQPEHYAYLARYRQNRWQVVPPPTPHGFFVPYCFAGQVWVVNTASDGAALTPGQWREWGRALNRAFLAPWAENQGLGRTYRWEAGQWQEAVAPPLVQRVYMHDLYRILPTVYGPALVLDWQGQRWAMVPQPPTHR